MIAPAKFGTYWSKSWQPQLPQVCNMIESDSGPSWVSVAQAARTLAITEAAVRKRIRSGTLPTRGGRGATEVLISVGNFSHGSGRSTQIQLGTAAEVDAARLAGEVGELRGRLADAQQDRDRWHAAATAALEKRAVRAAAQSAERELRILLGRI